MSRVIQKYVKSSQMKMDKAYADRCGGCQTGYFIHICMYICMYVQRVLCVLFQVSDVAKILGIVHTENIQVTAEAYDIALDISPGRNW